ncbi:hypothetical protein ACFLRQ_00420 [Bacteroidota bacterium]
MKKLLILFAVMLISIPALSQDRSKFLYAEFADKSVTYWPFYTLFGQSYDPSITLGAGMDYRQKGNLTLFQTLQLTGYTTWVTGKGCNVTTSIGYRYSHSSGLFGEAMIGFGTSAFLSSRQSFSQDEDGSYVPAYPLHVLASMPVDFVIGYGSGRLSFYLKYRYMMEGPYPKTIDMIIVPTSLIGIGVRYNIIEAND